MIEEQSEPQHSSRIPMWFFVVMLVFVLYAPLIPNWFKDDTCTGVALGSDFFPSWMFETAKDDPAHVFIVQNNIICSYNYTGYGQQCTRIPPDYMPAFHDGDNVLADLVVFTSKCCKPLKKSNTIPEYTGRPMPFADGHVMNRVVLCNYTDARNWRQHLIHAKTLQEVLNTSSS